VKPGKGRPPVGVERMLRIYFLQHWFNCRSWRWKRRSTIRLRCAALPGVDLGSEPVPTRRRCAASVICSKARDFTASVSLVTA
jgi:hypothetical protein